MKKRSIFDTAHWADLQQNRSEEFTRLKSQVQDLNRRLTEQANPITPDADVNMETEASGHETAMQLQREKIIESIEQAKQDIAESIKIELQPPSGYILFPEPADTEEEQTYTVEELTNETDST